MRRRVVVTGIGMINPLGHERDSVWAALQESQSGVAKTTLFDASEFPTKIAAEIKNWTFESDDPALAKVSRHTQFAIAAARQAMDDSGVLSSIDDPTRFGVYLGSGEGDQNFDNLSDMCAHAMADGEYSGAGFMKRGQVIVDGIREMEYEPNVPAARLADLFNAQGPNMNC